MEFSTRSIHRLIKEEGDMRVSEDAADRLGVLLEALADGIAEEAVRQAELDGKKTVGKEHMNRAFTSYF